MFLTLTGEEASREAWLALGFGDLVDRIEHANGKRVGTEGAHGMVEAWAAMMRRRYLSDERIERIAQELWQRHRAVLEFLMERRPDLLGELSAHFQTDTALEKIAGEVREATGLKLVHPQDRCGGLG